MDGGVADTARANTTVLTQAINRQSFGEEKALVSDALPYVHYLVHRRVRTIV